MLLRAPLSTTGMNHVFRLSHIGEELQSRCAAGACLEPFGRLGATPSEVQRHGSDLDHSVDE